jgi:hypothetical protein
MGLCSAFRFHWASLEDQFGEDLQLARVRSMSNGVAGVLSATIASVAAIGRAHAGLSGIVATSGIKQADRLLSNKGVALDECCHCR